MIRTAAGVHVQRRVFSRARSPTAGTPRWTLEASRLLVRYSRTIANAPSSSLAQQRQRQQLRCLSNASSSSSSSSSSPSSSSALRAKRTNQRQPRRRPKKPLLQEAVDDPQHQSSGKNKLPAIASAMIVPLMFAAWAATDYFLGNRTKGQNSALRALFEAEHPATATTTTPSSSLSSLASKPTLLHCVVRKTGGGVTHCLEGVRLGDVVEVLEEGVGPDRAYNLCRLPIGEDDDDDDVYGWFPIRWLQPLEHYEAAVRNQQVHLAKAIDPQ
eukprot:jgi/Psemu1/36899/gm1.36899_g